MFQSTKNPSAVQKAALADQNNMSVQQVSRWFENRRKKARLARAEKANDVAEPPAGQACEAILQDDDYEAPAEAKESAEEAMQITLPASEEPGMAGPTQQAGPSEPPAAGFSGSSTEQLQNLREEIRALESYVGQCKRLFPLKERQEGSQMRGQVKETRNRDCQKKYLIGSLDLVHRNAVSKKPRRVACAGGQLLGWLQLATVRGHLRAVETSW